MKVIVCQEEPVGGEPKREALVEYWKEYLIKLPEIDEIVVKDGFRGDRADEIIEDADIVLGAWISPGLFTRELFDRHPNLKFVSTSGHGFGEYDREAAKEKGITFVNTIYGDHTIAEYGMAMLMNICHHIDTERAHYKELLDLPADQKYKRAFVATRQIELYEKTMGIVGLGSIGFCMAQMAAGFGMKVVAYSRHKKEGAKYDFIEQVSMDELLERSDVISINCPLTESTRGLISKEVISKMKDGVILINTARGAIIDEEAMVEALKSGKIYAAGLDVLANEPVREHIPIFDLNNAEITAHIAWAPGEARFRVVRVTTENVKNWLAGTPTSVI